MKIYLDDVRKEPDGWISRTANPAGRAKMSVVLDKHYGN